MKAIVISFQTCNFQQKKVVTLTQTLPIYSELTIFQEKCEHNALTSEEDAIKTISCSSDFSQAISVLVQILSKASIKFVHLPLITFQKDYFQILREQFTSRKMQFPTVMLNVIDIYQIFKLEFGISINCVKDMAKFLRIGNQQLNRLNMVKQIWQKLNQNNKMIKYTKINRIIYSQSYKSIYFKVSGFPVEVSRQQIQQYFNMQTIQYYFIYKNSIFSGVLVFKVQLYFIDCFQKKIQVLYSPNLQIQKIGSREFQDIINHQECCTNNITKNFKSIKNYQKSTRQRSRQKDFQMQQQMCALRLRGLPFNIQIDQIYKLFRPYRVIKQSIKFGHRNGRKSGQVMMAFKQRQKAIDALQEDGKLIMNRYLQIKLSTALEYQRFQ